MAPTYREVRVFLLVILLASLLSAGVARAQFLPEFPPPPIPLQGPFDLDTGNPLTQVVIPRLVPLLAQDASPTLGDITMVTRFTTVLFGAMMDAMAPYHPTAVGIYTRIERRPEEEWTLRNINTASLYAAYHAGRGLLPYREPTWQSMLTDFGLDPADGADPSTPAGIGLAAGKGAVAGRLHDGLNQTGGYANNTGYVPVNSAYELVDASRWQPAIARRGMGLHNVQQFVTPQMANTEPFSDFNPRDYRIPPPTASNPANQEAYKAQLDHVLELSASLTDEQKMEAEFFDNKIVSLGWSLMQAAVQHDLSPMDFTRAYWLSQAAAFDAMIVIWQEKARYDAVRPFSAAAYVYGNEPVTAWGGPGMGTMEVPASRWQSYLGVADHPEYPSATTCSCQAHGQALRRYFGSDELGLSVTYVAGSSRIEPGITPAQHVTLDFPTWTDFQERCGPSRGLGWDALPRGNRCQRGHLSRFRRSDVRLLRHSDGWHRARAPALASAGARSET